MTKARRLIYGLGLTDRVDFCVGDGAQALKEPPDVAVIAGMGGQTIAGIVERGRDMLENARGWFCSPTWPRRNCARACRRRVFASRTKSSPATGGGCISSSRRRRGKCASRRRRAEVGPVLLQEAPAAAFRLRGLPPARGGQGACRARGADTATRRPLNGKFPSGRRSSMATVRDILELLEGIAPLGNAGGVGQRGPAGRRSGRRRSRACLWRWI